MAKKPYKYRQARKDAKAAAKKAFPGKVKAVRKDITGKITAEDRMALKDMADTAKKELGKKAYLSRAEYDAMQNKELEKFRESMRQEFGEYGGKKATPEAPVKKSAPKVTDKRTSAEKVLSKKAAAKEVKKNTKKFVAKGSPKVVDTPVTKGGQLEKNLKAEKAMTRAERSAANKAAWAKMTPAERKNWQASKPTAKPIKPRNTETPAKPIPKTAKGRANYGKYGTADEYAIEKNLEKEAKSTKATKRPTLASLKKNESAYLEETKARLAAKNKALANSAKGKTQTPTATAAKKKAAAKPEGKPAVKKVTPKKFARTRGLVKGGVIAAIAGEAVSAAKGSTEKDWKEIQRLENKLAALKGQKPKYKNMGSNKNPIAAMKADAGNLAALASMGIVGKTRRGRMDELNAMIAKQSAKNANKKDYSVRGRGPAGPASPAGKAAAAIGGGGSTTTTGTKYTVKKGDTFEGIAKSAGVSTKELRAANPYIMKTKKYKQGNMIWSGTKVNIPKK